LRKATVSVVISVRRPLRMEQLGSHWTDFHRIRYLSIQVRLNLTRILDTVEEDKYIFMTIYFSFILRIGNDSEKICGRNHNTRFIFCNFFLTFVFKCAVYEVMWKNMVDPGRLQVLIWRVSIDCRIPRATNPSFGICNSYCFYTAAVVAEMCLIVSLYVHCLSSCSCASFFFVRSKHYYLIIYKSNQQDATI